MTKLTFQSVNIPFLFAALLSLLAAAIRTWDGELGPLMHAREIGVLGIIGARSEL